MNVRYWSGNFSFTHLLIGSFVLIFSTYNIEPEILYLQPSTVPFDWYNISDTSTLEIKPGDTINQIFDSNGLLLFYSQDISTNVCFDEKCRPLKASVYWNITGRYMGFSLPEKEFLSRQDHEPFIDEDYSRLNTLLSDSRLPFKNLSFDELITQSSNTEDNVDAISGATSKSLSAFVVDGAAYTTFTLWNIIYGNTQKQIKTLTMEQMTPHLLSLILQSPSSQDRIWGLDQIDQSIELDPTIENAILDIIKGDDFFTSYSALKLIGPIQLSSETLQTGLFSQYQEVNYSLRKLIIQCLMKSPKISTAVIENSQTILGRLNGEQLGNILELYHRFSIQDTKTCQLISHLLKNENKFISEKAYNFLINLDINNEAIERDLMKYRKLR